MCSLKYCLEALAAEALDGLADPVDVDAVLPALARVEHQRQAQRDRLALDDARDAGVLLVAEHVRVPDVVGEARGMRQQGGAG